MARRKQDINARKRDNGLYERRFMVNGKRYSVYGANKKELDEKEKEKKRQLESGLKDNTNIILDNYFTEWITEKGQTVKPTTITTYTTLYKKHISPVFGKCKLQKIEKRAVRDFMADIKAEYSARTYNTVKMVLCSLFSAAVDDDILLKSPARGIKGATIENTATKSIHRALTIEEQAAFLETAKDSCYYNLFCFLLCSGVRIGEAGALTWNDIDYMGGVVRIHRTLTRQNGKIVIGESTKTKTSCRDIPLNEDIKAALRRQREQQKVLGIENLVFTSAYGKYLSAAAVNKEIDRITKKAGIERFTVHGLRDTFATRFIENDGKPEILMRIMGHSDYKITMELYAQVLPERKKAEMQRIKII